MPLGTKIATCCYCGTRAALVLTGRNGHELACSGCGAPLHNLKQMPIGTAEPDAHRPRTPGRRAPAMPAARDSKVDPRRKKRKKRKSPAKRFFEEAFDLLDDIFD